MKNGVRWSWGSTCRIGWPPSLAVPRLPVDAGRRIGFRLYFQGYPGSLEQVAVL